MRKITVWICLLSLGTSASAQTAASLRSELLDLAGSALDSYSSISALRFNPSPSACSAANSGAVALGSKLMAYIDRTKPFFDSSSNSQYFYIRQASLDLFASVTSMLTASNKVCSSNGADREIAGLHLQIADLKLDIFGMHLWKEDR